MARQVEIEGELFLEAVRNIGKRVKEVVRDASCSESIQEEILFRIDEGRRALGEFASSVELAQLAETEKLKKRSKCEDFTPVENRVDGNCIVDSFGQGVVDSVAASWNDHEGIGGAVGSKFRLCRNNRGRERVGQFIF